MYSYPEHPDFRERVRARAGDRTTDRDRPQRSIPSAGRGLGSGGDGDFQSPAQDRGAGEPASRPRGDVLSRSQQRSPVRSSRPVRDGLGVVAVRVAADIWRPHRLDGRLSAGGDVPADLQPDSSPGGGVSRAPGAGVAGVLPGCAGSYRGRNICGEVTQALLWVTSPQTVLYAVAAYQLYDA